MIEFNHGAVYEYFDVPESVFKEMAAARSRGRFFMEKIRDKYPFAQVER